jgi:predicted RNA binding protein YcfA (HicA-like mRNA interferase family)
MPKLKILSGKEVIGIFKMFGFETHAQKGSHLKLRRVREGMKETLIVPLHKTLDTGTLRAILRQAGRFVPLDELKKHFYQ